MLIDSSNSSDSCVGKYRYAVVRINGREAVAVPGTLVHFPAGTVHGFRFGKGGSEMLSITSREGASHLFADVDREVSPNDPDLARLIEVSGWHGLEVFLPPN